MGTKATESRQAQFRYFLLFVSTLFLEAFLGAPTEEEDQPQFHPTPHRHLNRSIQNKLNYLNSPKPCQKNMV